MLMDPWIEIYDNEQVQWHLRQQVTNRAASIVASISVGVLAWSVAALHVVAYRPLLILVAVGAFSLAAWTAIGIVRLRNRVWCIKMSPHMVMGYDYRRSPATVSWSEVSRVNVTSDSIALVCDHGVVMELPGLFPDFSHVSHRILDLAELHRIPIHVNGRSLLDTDILELLPELGSLFSVPTLPDAA